MRSAKTGGTGEGTGGGERPTHGWAEQPAVSVTSLEIVLLTFPRHLLCLCDLLWCHVRRNRVAILYASDTAY
jgi:hypothetical protein